MAFRSEHQRVVLGMLDGFGMDYLEGTEMPVLRSMREAGLFRQVSAVFPSVTNVNNVSICCGTWPAEHHIIGNSYIDPETGATQYMNASSLVASPTLFERAARHGVRSVLLTSKRKTTELLHRGTDRAIAAECPPPEWVERL